MTDVAARTDNADYRAAVDRLWDDLVGTQDVHHRRHRRTPRRRGVRRRLRAAQRDRLQRNLRAVGNALWNHRMNLLHGDAKYADVVERIIYNGFLSGVSLQGDKFFYVNPLASRGGHHRQEWYSTACCPVNVVRFLPSLPGYVYATSEDGVYVNLYAQSDATIPVKGQKVRVGQDTQYPWDGKVKLTLQPGSRGRSRCSCASPEWVEPNSVKLTVNADRIAHVPQNNGYAPVRVVWKDGDTIELDLPMPVKRVKANPKVEADKGRVAIQRGPIVYCLEAVDNGGNVSRTRAAARQRADERAPRPTCWAA